MVPPRPANPASSSCRNTNSKPNMGIRAKHVHAAGIEKKTLDGGPRASCSCFCLDIGVLGREWFAGVEQSGQTDRGRRREGGLVWSPGKSGSLLWQWNLWPARASRCAAHAKPRPLATTAQCPSGNLYTRPALIA
jgi:hypothetical protein